MESKVGKKFAVGYFFPHTQLFTPLAEEYASCIKEVYFPLPGLLSARQIFGEPGELRKILVEDLTRCRQLGFALDLLLNATCYGDRSCTPEQTELLKRELNYLDSHGLLPEIVTTTSPFIAMYVKRIRPGIEIRASVNMRLNSTLAMEYVADYFDSYYIGRDVQRDLPTVKLFRKWADDHGKKLCLLANSNCLRHCPWQTFHETLLAHNFQRACRTCKEYDFPVVLCAKLMKQGKFEEFLRSSWIRPEDLHLYAPYFDAIKLSTRQVIEPQTVLRAYTSGKFNGNLFRIIDPGFLQLNSSYWLDNSAFPAGWTASGTAGLCAINCRHCDKCESTLRKVLKNTRSSGVTITV